MPPRNNFAATSLRAAPHLSETPRPLPARRMRPSRTPSLAMTPRSTRRQAEDLTKHIAFTDSTEKHTSQAPRLRPPERRKDESPHPKPAAREQANRLAVQGAGHDSSGRSQRTRPVCNVLRRDDDVMGGRARVVTRNRRSALQGPLHIKRCCTRVCVCVSSGGAPFFFCVR